jgi:hypothetical protein
VKLLAAAVAAAVLLLTAGTIWFGARVREDTVVAHPYEEGLEYDQQRKALQPAGGGPSHAAADAVACDLGTTPCTRSLGDLELTLDMTPRPPRAMSELEVRGRLLRNGVPVDGAEVILSFAMPGMSMGENLSRLAPAAGGWYQGKAILVRCHSGRRDWIAAAVVRHGGQEHRADFALGLGR